MRIKRLLPVSVTVTTALLATGGCGGLVDLSQGNEQAADDSQDPNNSKADGVADLTVVFGEKAQAPAASILSAPVAASAPPSATTLSLEPLPPSDSGSVEGSPGVALPIPEDIAQKPPLSDAELKAMSESSSNQVQSEGARTLSLELSAEGGEARLFSLDLSKSNELSVKDLRTGTWTLAIRLLDAAGKVQLEGKGQIVVVEGKQNKAHLAFEADDKTGVLTLVVDNPDEKGTGERPLPTPSQFVNLESKQLFLEVDAGTLPGGCGPLRTTLQWQPGRAEIAARFCTASGLVERGYVIERPEGLQALRHFLADVGREARAVDKAALSREISCALDSRPRSLFAKFEDSKGQGTQRTFSADPLCAIQSGQFEKVDGQLPFAVLGKVREELGRIGQFMGKRIYENSLGKNAPPPPPAEDVNLESLVQSRDELRVSLKEALRLDCKANFDCVAIPFGARACGGPEGFLVGSRIASDMVRVGQIRDKEFFYSMEINKQSSAVGICSAVAQPVVYCNTTASKCAVK